MSRSLTEAYDSNSAYNIAYSRKEMEYTQEPYPLQVIKERLFGDNEIELICFVKPKVKTGKLTKAELIKQLISEEGFLLKDKCFGAFIKNFSKQTLIEPINLKDAFEVPNNTNLFVIFTASKPLKTKQANKPLELKAYSANTWQDEKNTKSELNDEILTFAKLKLKLLKQDSLYSKDHYVHKVNISDTTDRLCIYRVSALEKHNSVEKIDDDYKKHFLANLINFLAYRSQGNPKKLGEILSTMIYPSGRVFSRELEINEEKTKESIHEKEIRESCQNVLYLSDVNMIRIQLLSQLFEQTQDFFHERLVGRDDKIICSIFYLSDFLFKFHKRAFAWDSLDKIDEMADINRAPDIRAILQQIVNACSPTFFRQILNGMYIFRFRSEVAKEIAYISRLSPTEMAAFNFTLDESTSIKDLYLSKLKDGKMGDPSLITSLGELYEYDEEFDSARKEYNRALICIDNQLKEQIFGEVATGNKQAPAGTPDDKLPSLVYNILAGNDKTTCRLYSTWAVFRLRLMLQIGMTYEQSKNLERAQMQYSDADVFAKRIIQSLIPEQPTAKAKASTHSKKSKTKAKTKNRTTIDAESEEELNYALLEAQEWDANALHILKHFNLLYQPLFAKAWVAEKLEGSVDTSIDIVEKAIDYLRKILPFYYRHENTTPSFTGNSNLFLVISELHNKAGDLCFFKGMSSETTANQTGAIELLKGYLYQAHYHYALSFHEIREYIGYRIENAKYIFGVLGDKDYFGKHTYPAFIYSSLASNLCGMSESTLARVDSWKIFSDDPPDEGYHDMYLTMRSLNKFIIKAEIAKPDRMGPHCKEDIALLELWTAWYGKALFYPDGLKRNYQKKTTNKKQLLEFEETEHTDFERLAVYLIFSDMAYNFLIQGGYPENAINEHIKTIRTISRMLFWYKVKNSAENTPLVSFLLSHAFEKAV
ncbi:MAG: hypothetical protein MJK04_08140, partial [Psychrosphaera sp.]|nr:hypothetical protein [Psychrosphaera sp.]